MNKGICSFMKFPWELGGWFPSNKTNTVIAFSALPSLLFLLKNFTSKIARGKRGRGRGTHSLPEAHQDQETHSLEEPHNTKSSNTKRVELVKFIQSFSKYAATPRSMK